MYDITLSFDVDGDREGLAQGTTTVLLRYEQASFPVVRLSHHIGLLLEDLRELSDGLDALLDSASERPRHFNWETLDDDITLSFSSLGSMALVSGALSMQHAVPEVEGKLMFGRADCSRDALRAFAEEIRAAIDAH